MIYPKPPLGNRDYFNAALVERQITYMSSGRAPGRSGIRNELVKHCGKAIAPVLAKFYNLCIRTGFIPSNWRIARIIPIPKKENATDISDHRPISLTEILRKLFERLASVY
jgi:hypothetical protein